MRENAKRETMLLFSHSKKGAFGRESQQRKRRQGNPGENNKDP